MIFGDLPSEEGTKDVTIRGVDAQLYDRFSHLASQFGTSTGNFFTIIMRASYLHEFRNKMLIQNHTRHAKRKSVETIYDKNKLVVTRKDLEAIQSFAWVNFIRIKHLVFSEDVDTNILLQNVGLIQDCNTVEFLGDVSYLAKVGLVIRKPVYTYPTAPSKLKDITIRNVNKTLYNQLLAESKQKNIKVGELFSQKLSITLPHFELRATIGCFKERFPLFIMNVKELTVSKKDLDSLGKRKVAFYQIEKLRIDNDVLHEQFFRQILGIVSCKKVIIPKSMPKLILLSRVNNCDIIISE